MISAFLGVRFFVLLSSKILVICITEELLFYFCVQSCQRASDYHYKSISLWTQTDFIS